MSEQIPPDESKTAVGQSALNVELGIVTGTRKDATLRLYHAINGPAKAGRTWVTYERKVIDAALVVIKQLMELEGYSFKPENKTPNERS